jgi:hypothetical protein
MKCNVCKKKDTTRGVYCESCLDREIDTVADEDIIGAAEFYEALGGADEDNRLVEKYKKTLKDF